MLTHVGFKKKKKVKLTFTLLINKSEFFFLLTEINYNICSCYEFESFPQNVNKKNIEICVNLFKENKMNYKRENCALQHGA